MNDNISCANNPLLKKWMWISIASCLIPVIPGLFLYSALPAQMAIHFNSGGQPDGYMPKLAVILLMPCVFAAFNALAQYTTLRLCRKYPYPRPVQILFLVLLPAMDLLVMLATYVYALHPTFNIASLIIGAVGILFLVLGNYMPKVAQNSTFGIRTKWTYANAEVWQKTNRLGGWLFALIGLLMLITAIVQSEAMLIFTLVLVMALSLYLIWYSRHLYLQLEQKAKQRK